MPASARFAVGARSHPGMVRADNEDAYVADDGVYVVADGMGGHQAGEVASALAVDALRRARSTGFRSVTDLERAVRDANSSIRMQAADAIERAGMGTTLTGIVLLEPTPDEAGPRLAIANVGDSRTYLHRGRTLVRLTVDHSYVQELVRTGQISEQEARFHPRRNIVTRALGIDHSVAVDAWVRACVRGDRYLVCSDGLVDEVPDHEIAAVLDGIPDPQVAADQLVEMANRHGGRDNVTVIVVDVVEGLDNPPDDDVLPASAVDDGGLPSIVTWMDGGDDPAATRGMPITGSPTTSSAVTRAVPTTATQALPVTPVGAHTPGRRRFGLAQLLFLVALGAIITVVVVVALVAAQDDPSAPDGTVVTTRPSATTVQVDTTTNATPSTASPTSSSPAVSASTSAPATGLSTP